MNTPAPFRTLGHAVRVSRGLTGRQWAALGQAALWVPPTRAALTVFPWRRISALFDRAEVRAVEPDLDRARTIVWAVDAVARRVVRQRPCLTQALVARHLLRRHGVESSLQIGAARDKDGAFRAHAWLEWEGEIVIGGQASSAAYTSFKPLTPRGHATDVSSG
ncbi:MAG: lasso peptide biosynthesis B2 protein [Bacteroidota bacterium]